MAALARAWLAARLATPTAQRLGRWLRIAFVLGVIVFLAIRLTEIGWANVWAAHPRNWLFYALLLAAYAVVPVNELLVYRLLWRRPMRRHASVFFRKRVYNNTVLGYSGEGYLYLWARQVLNLPPALLVRTIKDSNVLSALASNSLVALLLLAFLASGQLRITIASSGKTILYGIVGILAAALIVTVLVRFRHIFVSVPRRVGWRVFGLHGLRFTLGQALLLGQWIAALPDIPIGHLFTLLALQMILSRIPLLPSKDLIFVGLGVSLSSVMSVSEASIAGVLLVASALNQVLNLSVMTLGALKPRPVPHSDAAGETVEAPDRARTP